MSLFATLRRRKGKKGPADGELSSSSLATSVFNSTPNLHKLDNNKDNKAGLSAGGYSSSSVFKPRNMYSSSGDSSTCGTLNRKASLEVPSAHSTPGPEKRRPSFGISSSGNIRPFVSMVSMVNSLKRATSAKKLSFGSAMYLNSKDGGKDEEEFRKSACKSEEKLHHSLDLFHYKNQEPGVTSSNSSSASDLGSISGGRGSLRNSSERSDIPEEREEFSDEYHEKSPEEKLRAELFLQGIKKFNMDHKKGIEFLVSKELIQNSVEGVAQFLKQGEGLSKTAIGNYLGERIDFNEDVLRAFVELHDFSNVILVQALRQFLWSFRLPGEAQKIDRMMEAFAKRYCQLNPEIFASTDTCYLLSYAIIMLNTTLHNPNVKEKPSVEQFIRMNRDIDGGKALNTGFIISLYNSIQAEPFKIPPEDGNDLMLTFFNPDIEGWLWKQGGGRYKSWKRRWFILSNNCLYYFKFTTDKTPRGIIPLENITVKATSDKFGKPFAFHLVKETPYSHVEFIKTCKTMSNGTTVPVQYSSIHLAAFNIKEREKWMKSITNNNSLSKFYSELTLKKRKAEEMNKHGKCDLPKKGTVRKSQISLPSTVSTVDLHIILPEEIYADPRKNPHNFFVEKNIRPVIQHISDDTDSLGEKLSMDQEHGSDMGLGSSLGSFDISQSASMKSDDANDHFYDGDSTISELNTSGITFEEEVDNVLEVHSSLNTTLCSDGEAASISDHHTSCTDNNPKFEAYKKLSMIEESDRSSYYALDTPPVSFESSKPTFIPSIHGRNFTSPSDQAYLPDKQIETCQSTEVEDFNTSDELVLTKPGLILSLEEDRRLFSNVDSSMNISLVPRTTNCRLGKPRYPHNKSTEILMECDTAMTPVSCQPFPGLVPPCTSELSCDSDKYTKYPEDCPGSEEESLESPKQVGFSTQSKCHTFSTGYESEV